MFYDRSVARAKDKTALKNELLATIRESLGTLLRAQEDAQAAATHDEAKAEDDKDTRAIEQSYIARGHAIRIEELGNAVVELDGMQVRAFKKGQPIALSAVITVDESGTASTYFMAPHGGGVTLSGGIQVVTPKSPLGKSMLGKFEGDECEVRIGARLRELSIETVE
jgi:hypothetical protein